MLTPAQERFVELERQREFWKQYVKDLADAAQAVADESGTGVMFQDDENVVYQIVVPKGKWVAYDSIDYVRTKRQGEEKSPHPLAIKTAKAAGFDVEG